MKKLLFLTAFLYTIIASSQILNPVSWDFDSRKVSATEYELIFTANIDENWAVYSQYVDEGGPIPTGFIFEESEAFT